MRPPTLKKYAMLSTRLHSQACSIGKPLQWQSSSSAAQHIVVQHSTAQHSTAQRSAAQHTKQCNRQLHSMSCTTQDSIPTGMEGAKHVYSRTAWMLATALSMCPACISNRHPSMKNPTRASSVSARMLAGAPSRVRRVLSCFRACMPFCVSNPCLLARDGKVLVSMAGIWSLQSLTTLVSQLSRGTCEPCLTGSGLEQQMYVNILTMQMSPYSTVLDQLVDRHLQQTSRGSSCAVGCCSQQWVSCSQVRGIIPRIQGHVRG